MPRYRRDVWGGWYVFVKVHQKRVIEQWVQRSGFPRAVFLRMALLKGALALARELGLADDFPAPD